MNLKQTLNVVGVLLLIALVVPFVVYAVPATVGADHSFVVLTASMTPAIAPGDVVVVADRDPATIAEGDVITFTRGDNEIPVTHRVIDVVDDAGGLVFETKGDANEDPDASLVSAGSVVGTVVVTIPYIGYVVQFTNTPYGFVALVAGPIGLFVASELWTLYRRRSGSDVARNGRDAAVDGDEFVDAGVEPARNETADATDGTDDANAFVITVRTLEGAMPPLVVLAGYAGYTVYLRPGALSIAVAVGGAVSLLAAAALWVSATRGEDDLPSSPADSAPEAGVANRLTPGDNDDGADTGPREDAHDGVRHTTDGGTEPGGGTETDPMSGSDPDGAVVPSPEAPEHNDDDWTVGE